MILKGSQRGGPRQLTAHLMNDRDNDHIELVQTRGFVATDLGGAMAEAADIASGTRCPQFLFSLSLSPPKDQGASVEDMLAAVERAEEALGLKGQPRALVIHEKKGRRHMHAVWSRIDANEMKAINMSFFGNKLAALSKELYLEHGWDLPDGHRENGWKNPLNFTLAEWQQCQNLGLDPREVKQQFQDAWKLSDGPTAFRAALEDRGYYLARGDRRGFVAVDFEGNVFSVARMIGVKTRDMETRLGSPDALPGVEEVTQRNRQHLLRRAGDQIPQARDKQAAELAPLKAERDRMVAAQRLERKRIEDGQARRREAENRARQERIRQGFRGVLDLLIGRTALVRRQNEREALEAHRRDVGQREMMVRAQLEERADLQKRIEALLARQREERAHFVRTMVGLLRLDMSRAKRPANEQQRDFGLEL